MSFIKAQLKTKFGLIAPKKPPAIFAVADDDDAPQTVNEALKLEAERKKRQISTKEEQQKVLEQDPSAFDYDEVYDAMKSKTAPPTKKSQPKGPQYMQNLIDKAKERKIIYDMSYERKLRKEQEAEGDLYQDKEKFLTSAYRTRLEELDRWKKAEDEQDRKDTARTAEGGMFNFYANLMDNNVAMGGTAKEGGPAPVQPTPKASLPKAIVAAPSTERPAEEGKEEGKEEGENKKEDQTTEDHPAPGLEPEAKRQKIEISKELLAEAKQLSAEDQAKRAQEEALRLLEEKKQAEVLRKQKAEDAKARFLARKQALV